MTFDEAKAQLRRLAVFLSDHDREAIDVVLGEVERLQAELAALAEDISHSLVLPLLTAEEIES